MRLLEAHNVAYHFYADDTQIYIRIDSIEDVKEKLFCSDRILTCRIKSIRSPAKVGLVVTDLITSPVVSWEGWETPPPSTAALLSFFAQPPAW